MPLLLALMASAAQVQSARDSGSRQQRRQEEGTELQPLGPQRSGGMQSPAAAAPPVSSMVAALLLLVAALAQPAVLTSPYMLSAAGAVWRWSAGTSGGGGRSGRSGGGLQGLAALLQPYTAAYLTLLYVWQATLGSWPLVQPAARLLGLFSFSADEEWPQLLPAALQLAAMLLLFLSLGLAGSSGSGSAADEGSSGVPASAASWGRGGEQAPLLQHGQQEQQAQLGGRVASPSRGAAPPHPLSMRQLLHLLLLDTGEVLCREPAVVAAVLCGGALVQPSLLSGTVLLWALAALLWGRAAHALRRGSRALTGALLVRLALS